MLSNGFPSGSPVNDSPTMQGTQETGDVGLVPVSGRSPEEEMATHSCIFV